MGFHEKIKGYFCSSTATDLNQLTIAFVLGLVVGPFSTSIIFRLLFIIVYEVVVFYYTRGLTPYWRLLTRIAINCASLYGYILGKWLLTNRTGLESFWPHL